MCFLDFTLLYMKNRPGLICIMALVVAITSCKKTIYKYPALQLTDYFTPLQVGKYAIYRLDSLNFYYYGQLDTITSYLAKDTIVGTSTDNSGRPIWLVTRYLSDTLNSGWIPNETYTITSTANTIEVVENNLRFIKLAFPISEGFSWTGDTYLPYAPYQDFFSYSDGEHLSLGLWNFTYQNVNKPYAVENTPYDSTITVLQVNDSANVPILDPNSYATRTYWSETYAKNVGLIYRHTEMWEYQPPTPNGTQVGYKIGFIVTMQMLQHN